MSTYVYGNEDNSRRTRGIIIVIALHLLLGWAIVTGTARNAFKMLKKPLEAVVIQEVIIPPPPPPPPKPVKIVEPKAPKVEAPPPPFVPPPDVKPPATSTNAIEAIQAPPPTPPVIAPPPPPAPPAPAAPKGPARVDIGVACKIVTPVMPRKAMQDGIEGVVRVQIHLRDGVVKDVNVLSGPRVFHSAVRDAIMQYKCTNEGEGIATQEFAFKLED